MPIHELKIGRKTIYLQIEPESAHATIDCDQMNPVGMVRIPLTTGQAERILRREQTRELIQDVLPELPPPVREVFTTGTTPAEWDEMFNGGRKHWRYYVNLHYVFDFKEADINESVADELDDREGRSRT